MTHSQAGQGATVTVPLEDLALVLYIAKPRYVGSQQCPYCGKPNGAHYCPTTEEARIRLRRAVDEADDRQAE